MLLFDVQFILISWVLFILFVVQDFSPFLSEEMRGRFCSNIICSFLGTYPVYWTVCLR